MPTYNGKPYSSTSNLSLKQGILRFGATQSSNPIGSSDYGIYVNGSGNLIFSAAGSSTTLGAAGSPGAIPSFDAIFQGDQTLQLGGLASFTIDRNSGNNDVLTITNSGAGSGDCIQITNVGTGNDIEGTSDTWHFTKAGDMTANTVVFAGDAGSNSITLTAGDVVFSDGSLAITDADNAATFTVTNDTATSASVVVLAGSGTFTGSTTSSWMTITPSGLTTGTAVYLPLAAMTQGTGLSIVANAITSGKALHVQSSVTGTTMTANGRLFYVEHTGTGTSSGTLVEVTTAAADETDVFKVTASGTLTGGAVVVSASSMAAGTAFEAADLDSLTTGIGVHIASAATAITTTGRLFYSNHTGATGTTATLNEFATSATDETVLLKLTTAAMINGVALNIVGTTGMTSGSLIRATSSTASAVATNGVYSFALTGNYTSSADTLGGFHIAGASTVAGTIFSILGGAQTTGIAAHISDPSTGMTSGSLLRIATATTGAVATNGIVSVRATGAYTSTSNVGLVDVLASATTAGTVVRIAASAAGQTATELLRVVASGYTTGYTGNVVNIVGCSTTGAATVLAVASDNSTAGNAVSITANGLTTGTGLLVTSSGAIVTTGELVSLVANSATTSTGVIRASATSLTDGFVMELTGGGANATSSGGVLNIAAGAATQGAALKVTTTGIYAGTVGVVDIGAASCASGVIVDINGAGLTDGVGLKINATEATLTTGFYLQCYDGAASDFTVGRYGAVVIAGTAATNMLTITAGHAVLTSGNLTLTSGNLVLTSGNATLTSGNLTLTSGNLVITAGNFTATGKIIFAATETIAAGGTSTALDLAKELHYVDADAGGDTFTLADGTAGQITTVVMKTSTGVATITPANLAGGTSVTLNAAGDSVQLQFMDTDWYIIGGNSYAVV